VGSFFAVSQILGVSPRIKIHHADSSMDRGIKIVPQVEQVFDLYRMMSKELKERKKQLPSQWFCKEKKKKRNIKLFLGGGGGVNYSRIFSFRGESWNLTPAKSSG
jgi:hypothetical protein